MGVGNSWTLLKLSLEILSQDEDNLIHRLFGSMTQTTYEPSQRRINAQFKTDSRPLKCQYWEISLREREVLKLVADGFSSKEVADRLNISTHTAINHRKNLITKFRVRNTAELIKEATRTLDL